MVDSDKTTKVIWHQTTSIDGFVTAADGAAGWAFGHGGPSKEVFDELMRTIGAVVTGRRTYDLGPATGKPFYGGKFEGPIFVVTHEPPAEHPERVRFVTDGVVSAVEQARAAANGKNVVVTGPNVASQCIAAGQMDEALIHMVPVLLGGGLRVFAEPGPEWRTLETIGVARSGAVFDLRYRFPR